MGLVNANVRPRVLQEVTLITYTPDQCYKKHFYYNPDYNPDEVEQHPIPVWKGYGSCTVDGYGHNYPKTGQSSTCPGDSGSPVFWEDINDNQRAYMIGINKVEKTIMQRFGE